MSKRAASTNTKTTVKRSRLQGTAIFHNSVSTSTLQSCFTDSSISVSVGIDCFHPFNIIQPSSIVVFRQLGTRKSRLQLESLKSAKDGVVDAVQVKQEKLEVEDDGLRDNVVMRVGEENEDQNSKGEKKKRSVQSMSRTSKPSGLYVSSGYFQRHPNIEWKEKYRHIFVDELMRWKGRGDSRKQARCTDCKGLSEDGVREEGRAPSYRCESCFMGDLVCQECCVRRHWDSPFHIVKNWDGSAFTTTTLREMGLTIQLNHYGGFCAASKPAYDRLLVLHTNGIHSVNIRFCQCSEAIPQYLQLLRRRLYPGNLRKGRIATAVTFEYLESLQIHTLTTKGSIYDFYRALERMTNNTGGPLPPSRYKQLLRIIRQWRHCKMIMRSGFAQYDCSRIDEEPEGAMTIRCPSCPHPGINLDDNWKQQGESVARLKEQLVSSHSRDPALCDGLGYFVRRGPFEEWVEENNRKNNPEDEISDCVPFAALSKQNTKFSKGLRYTGVGAAACGRMDMIFRIANLNK
ncbi:hypothetical protein V5O48_013067 [Marasmius crinis-equi]|uniref:CxC2-like cysteine cluster KDZ transposase-associated domain-containing protein n=1 Tax=Marasmius crinis-equi TaxID=585013 RepID=A0ABR3F136_9AGAR